MLVRIMIAAAVLCGELGAPVKTVSSIALAADAALQKEVAVSGETRLDWTFVVSNQSVVRPPEEWTRDYVSMQQRYDLFVPPAVKTARVTRKKPDGLPMILFISAGDTPAGWDRLESLCRQKGIVYASPYGAGNGTPTPRRAHIILDVLDDVRRRASVDPDRTYIAGFSGGGRVACAVAFALPELFGGVIPVCAGGELRDEPWLRHRAIDRLSVSLLTGTEDFNLGEIERFRGPMWTDMGIRTRVTVVPKLGHAIPETKVFQAAFEWLEAGLADRRKFAERFPASRLEADSESSREDQAKALLAEAEARLRERKTLFSGLMQLQGVMTRWSDLPEGDAAKKILLKYEGQADKPWEDDDVTEQRRFLVARVRALDAYASGALPDQYAKQRPDMARAAIELWEGVIQDGQDSKAVSEGRRRIPILQKLVDAKVQNEK